NLIHLLPLAPVRCSRGMKDNEHERPVGVDIRSTAGAVDDFRRGGWDEHPGDVAARTANSQNRFGSLAHAHEVIGGPFGAWKMIVSKFRDRVPGALVD